MKFIKSTFAVLVILAVVIFSIDYLSGGSDRREETAPDKINMYFVVSGDSVSVKIRYFTLEKEDDPVTGYVSNQYTKTVLSSGLKVSVEPGAGGRKVSCKILRGSNDKVLDESGPSETASCEYYTF